MNVGGPQTFRRRIRSLCHRYPKVQLHISVIPILSLFRSTKNVILRIDGFYEQFSVYGLLVNCWIFISLLRSEYVVYQSSFSKRKLEKKFPIIAKQKNVFIIPNDHKLDQKINYSSGDVTWIIAGVFRDYEYLKKIVNCLEGTESEFALLGEVRSKSIAKFAKNKLLNILPYETLSVAVEKYRNPVLLHPKIGDSSPNVVAEFLGSGGLAVVHKNSGCVEFQLKESLTILNKSYGEEKDDFCPIELHDVIVNFDVQVTAKARDVEIGKDPMMQRYEHLFDKITKLSK